MKINYRNSPILKTIWNKGDDLYIAKDDEFHDVDLEFMKSILGSITSSNPKIQLLTKPFLEAISTSNGKNFDFTLAYPFLIGMQGVFILFDRIYAYKIDNREAYMYLWKGDKFAIFCKFHIENNRLETEYLISGKIVFNVDRSAALRNQVVSLLNTICFVRFSDIQTKNLAPNKREKLFNVKYLNETDLPIHILDSTWFTNLVKSDAFKVRGHFRLQPCGEGMKDRKLIYVQDFEKKGYTRKAGILKAQE